MHLFDASFPYAPGPVLTHGDASLEDYRSVQRRLRLQRHVIVQPSSYGTDNRILMRGLKESTGSARGVAVIDTSIDSSALAAMHASGVRGVRFNLVQSGATDETMLEQVAETIEPLGWHIQLHAPPAELIRLHPRLADLPVDVVLDHFARANVDARLTEELAATVVRMLRAGRTWLKLSGAYIASSKTDTYDDLDVFVEQCVVARSDRLLWGTDWPHVTESTKPDDARLMNLMKRWLTDSQIQQVLVRNPEKIYCF